MKKILYMTMLFMFMAVVTTYAANWTTLKVPLKSANDALILQEYDADRLVLLASSDKKEVYGIYFWRRENFARPDTGKGEINYRLYRSFIDLKKKPWVIKDALIYTKVQWSPAITTANPDWVTRGTATPDNPENQKIAEQILYRANELMEQNKLKVTTVPIRLQTVVVPNDMR